MWDDSPNFGDAQLDTCRFNQVVYKLLTVINGADDVAGYMQFATDGRIFMQDSASPYFKLNLLPISFSNTDPELWISNFSQVTGFVDKDEYIKACHEHRFAAMRQWVQTYQPRLIICFGESWDGRFDCAYSDNDREFMQIDINGLTLKYKVNDNDTILTVLPFPNAPHGLKGDDDIWAMGVFLRGLLK